VTVAELLVALQKFAPTLDVVIYVESRQDGEGHYFVDEPRLFNETGLPTRVVLDVGGFDNESIDT